MEEKRLLEDMLYVYIIHSMQDLNSKYYSRDDARDEAQRILEHYEHFEHVLQTGTKQELDFDVSYLRMVASNSRIYSADTNEEWL